MDTAAKYIVIDSADRSEGSIQNFRLQFRNPINEVRNVTLFSTNITRDASMTDYLLMRLSIATGEVRTTDEIIATYVIPVDSAATNVIYKIGIDGKQTAHACVKMIHDIRVELINHDGSVPTLAEYTFVLHAN